MKHVLVIAMLALPVVAFAGPREQKAAEAHVDKATEAHGAGNYEVALTELQAAYALDPQPNLLYAMGQVHVKLGHCDEAIASYEQFLATNPEPEPAALANEAIASCKAQEPPPPPEPAPVPAVTQPPPPPMVAESKPFYTDKIGDVLVGAGVVSIAVGIIMYSSAVGTLDDADAAATYAEHEQLVDDAQTRRSLGVVFGVVGLAAVGVGVWHFTKYHSEQAVAVSPTASGGMISWMGHF